MACVVDSDCCLGLWEFNARPYAIYYAMALLIVEEVAEPVLSDIARAVCWAAHQVAALS